MYSITLNTHNKDKPKTAKEALLRNLRWKLKFHQEQADKVLNQIKELENE